MNLSTLSDELLLVNTKGLANREREITLQTLYHLRKIERRLPYAKLSYSSLFEYVVKELKYSEGAAQRRISSMRLLKELPELAEKIESGVLTLSALAQAQSFFRQEKIHVKDKQDKREVLSHLENKSLWEVQRELVGRSSEPHKLVPEKLRAVSETHSELKILVDDNLLKEIEELRGLLARTKPTTSVKDLITFAIGRTLNELRTKAPKNRPIAVTQATAAAAVKKKRDSSIDKALLNSRYIPQEVKREVWNRDKGQCTFVNPVNGRGCCSKHGLEYDHIQPFALGGRALTENLRMRCRAHNQLAALQSFGHKKMSQFVLRMR